MVQPRTPIRNLELRLAYSGQGVHGWQIQPDRPTVQGILQKALARVLEVDSVRTTGASRTDAGVHAHDQHVTFETANPIPGDKLRYALENVLPPGIRVLEVREREPGFSARYHARAKHYAYFIHNAPVTSPFIAPFVWSDRRDLDTGAMESAAAHLVGTRCFRALQSQKDHRHQTETTIFAARVRRRGDLVCFEVVGRHFLYHMVRNMLGSLVLVGRGEWRAEDLAEGLAEGDRRAMGITAPASGLHLFEISYDEGPYGFSPASEGFLEFLSRAPVPKR